MKAITFNPFLGHKEMHYYGMGEFEIAFFGSRKIRDPIIWYYTNHSADILRCAGDRTRTRTRTAVSYTHLTLPTTPYV